MWQDKVVDASLGALGSKPEGREREKAVNIHPKETITNIRGGL